MSSPQIMEILVVEDVPIPDKYTKIGKARSYRWGSVMDAIQCYIKSEPDAESMIRQEHIFVAVHKQTLEVFLKTER